MSRVRIAVGVLLVLCSPVVVLGCLLGAAFWGNEPLEDGRAFDDGGVVTVVDGYVACFLVETSAGYALVDACQDPEATAIAAALAARGATLADVHSVLLTHSHDDHIGGLGMFGHAQIRGLAPAGPLLAGEAAHEGPLPSLMGARDSGARLTAPVIDGERFVLGETMFTAFAVPGHTADSAVYLSRGVLFLGDSGTYKADGELVVAPWIFSDDQDENLASMQALARRLAPVADRIEWLAPAHTGPARGLAALEAM